MGGIPGGVHPAVGAQPDPATEHEVDAGIPVDQHQQVVQHEEHSVGMGEVGPALGALSELSQTVELEQADEEQGDGPTGAQGAGHPEPVQGEQGQDV